MKSFNEKVYEIVRCIPEGWVMTYGQIAQAAGNPRAARAVGYAMRNIQEGSGVPWHRVVFSDGSLSWGKIQKELLADENVGLTPDRKVIMSRHQWDALEAEAMFFEKEDGEADNV